MAEPIEMLFGGRACGTKGALLDGGQVGRTHSWREGWQDSDADFCQNSLTTFVKAPYRATRAKLDALYALVMFSFHSCTGGTRGRMAIAP